MALSPWPTSPAALANAIAVLREDCGLGSSATDDGVSRIGAAVAAMVEREAPAAPQAIRDEAMVRFAAYVYFTTKSQGFQTESLGPKSVTYSITNHSAMFRNSGAKALLSPWKVRHAGAIG